MHPELGFTEQRTSKLVCDALRSFGFDEVLTDFCKAHTAVVGILRTGRPGHVVGLRADMDALPMQDEKDVPYRSQVPGVCHACGHDGHTAALLGAAKYCAAHRDQLCGTIKFVFQPAEEGPAPGGAKYIVESGVLDDVEFMIGGHQSTYASVGQVLVKSGIACAGGHAFKLTLTGVGTHAISPQDGSDVISTAMQIIDSWQSMLSRQIDPQQPVVLSVCSIHAGEMGADQCASIHCCFFRYHSHLQRSPAGKYPEKDAPACGIHFQIQRLYMHDGKKNTSSRFWSIMTLLHRS